MGFVDYFLLSIQRLVSQFTTQCCAQKLLFSQRLRLHILDGYRFLNAHKLHDRDDNILRLITNSTYIINTRQNHN